jgi:hypothetical protein
MSSKLSPLKTKMFLASNPTITLVAIDPHMAIILAQIREKYIIEDILLECGIGIDVSFSNNFKKN